MSWDSNLYYNPEKNGLEIFGFLEYESCYDFSMCVVWRDTETDKLYYAFDSGCSCPTPFEDVTRDSIYPITPKTYDEFKDDVMSWADGYGSQPSMADIVEVLKKVSGHIGW